MFRNQFTYTSLLTRNTRPVLFSYTIKALVNLIREVLCDTTGWSEQASDRVLEHRGHTEVVRFVSLILPVCFSQVVRLF